MELDEELLKVWQKGHYKKLNRLLWLKTTEQDRRILTTLRMILQQEDSNGLIIWMAAKAYFRIKRHSMTDCEPLYELYDPARRIVQEALMEVLGYDRMVPSREDQARLINLFFTTGEGLDLTTSTDPRYGLAAACAGWDTDLVAPFLTHCLTFPDAPLQYVAGHALKRKYVALRAPAVK